MESCLLSQAEDGCAISLRHVTFSLLASQTWIYGWPLWKASEKSDLGFSWMSWQHVQTNMSK